ncbi:MAG: DUF6702 family protein [Bacteroidales bacterium]
MKTFFVYILLAVPFHFSNAWLANYSPKGFSKIQPVFEPSEMHPVHLSYTNIEFNPSAAKFEIMIKLFVDDFNTIILNKYGKDLKLLEGNPAEGASKYIDRYIMEHFRLVINGKDKTKSDMKFEKMEFKEQSIWLYYNYDFKANTNVFDINNSLMTDLYQDQTNLLIFTYKNEQKAIRFSNQKTNEKLTF